MSTSTMLEITSEKIEQNDVMRKFVSHCPMHPDGFIRIKPGNTVMPECYLKFHERMKGFKLRPDDIWIASFPKSGTTWTQEMVWNVMNKVDLETANTVSLEQRVPFLEFGGIVENSLKLMAENMKKTADSGLLSQGSLGNSMEAVDNLPDNQPRLIKTHLPVELLPQEVLKEHKIVYVSRNPRDVVVSFYNHWKILEGYSGDLDSFFNAFLGDVAGYYSPFFSHNIGFWNLRNNKNVLFIFYEDMKKDLKSVIQKVSDFLGKELTSTQIEALNAHLQFENMKKTPTMNKEREIAGFRMMSGIGLDGNFMNKGISGNWKNKLSQDQINRIRSWEEKNLQNTDLKFQYE